MHSGKLIAFGEHCDISLSGDRIRDYRKKSIVYVSTPSPEHFSMMNRPDYNSKRNDGSDNDKLWKEYNKLEVKIQRLGVEFYRNEIAEKLNVPSDQLKFKWSRTAGCSCGCSPGWLVYNAGTRVGDYRFYVTMKNKAYKDYLESLLAAA